MKRKMDVRNGNQAINQWKRRRSKEGCYYIRWHALSQFKEIHLDMSKRWPLSNTTTKNVNTKSPASSKSLRTFSNKPGRCWRRKGTTDNVNETSACVRHAGDTVNDCCTWPMLAGGVTTDRSSRWVLDCVGRNCLFNGDKHSHCKKRKRSLQKNKRHIRN